MDSLEYVREVGGESLIDYIYNLVYHQGKTPHQAGHSVHAVLKAQRNWDAPPAFIQAVADVAEQAPAEALEEEQKASDG